MTKQFAKKSIAATLTAGALAFAAVTPVAAADQSDWFEQQRAITDGVNIQPETAPDKGPRGRVGEPAANPVRAADQSEDWFEQQRAITDGVSIQSETAPDKGA
jgi:hypothetical protein